MDKTRLKQEKLYFALVDLEKAFDYIHQEKLLSM